jgi:hypothetical protein
MQSSVMWCRVVLVRPEVSKKHTTRIIRVTRICDFFFATCFSWKLLLTLFLARRFLSPRWWRRYFLRKVGSYKSHTA